MSLMSGFELTESFVIGKMCRRQLKIPEHLSAGPELARKMGIATPDGGSRAYRYEISGILLILSSVPDLPLPGVRKQLWVELASVPLSGSSPQPRTYCETNDVRNSDTNLSTLAIRTVAKYDIGAACQIFRRFHCCLSLETIAGIKSLHRALEAALTCIANILLLCLPSGVYSATRSPLF